MDTIQKATMQTMAQTLSNDINVLMTGFRSRAMSAGIPFPEIEEYVLMVLYAQWLAGEIQSNLKKAKPLSPAEFFNDLMNRTAEGVHGSMKQFTKANTDEPSKP